MKKRFMACMCAALMLIPMVCMAEDVTVSELARLKGEMENALSEIAKLTEQCANARSMVSLEPGVYLCGEGDLEPGYYVLHGNVNTNSYTGTRIAVYQEYSQDGEPWIENAVGPSGSFVVPLKAGWALKVTGYLDLERLNGSVDAKVWRSQYDSLIALSGVVQQALDTVDAALTDENETGMLIKPGFYICGEDTIPAGTYLFTMTRAYDDYATIETRTNDLYNSYRVKTDSPQVVITVTDGTQVRVKDCEGYLTPFVF